MKSGHLSAWQKTTSFLRTIVWQVRRWPSRMRVRILAKVAVLTVKVMQKSLQEDTHKNVRGKNTNLTSNHSVFISRSHLLPAGGNVLILVGKIGRRLCLPLRHRACPDKNLLLPNLKSRIHYSFQHCMQAKTAVSQEIRLSKQTKIQRARIWRDG